MPTSAEIKSLIEELLTNMGRLDEIVNGDDQTEVLNSASVSIPSILNLFRQINAQSGAITRDPVVVRAASNITLSGEQTIDGLTTSASRVAVTGQTAPAQNGVYVSASGAWARASDMNEATEINLSTVLVQGGTSYGGQSIRFTVADPETFALGTDAITAFVVGDVSALQDYLDAGVAGKASAASPVETLVASGTGQAMTAAAPAWMTEYVDGQIFLLFPSAANTASDPTFNIGGYGPLPIKDEGSNPLVANDLQPNRGYLLRVSGSQTSFRILTRGYNRALVDGLSEKSPWRSPTLFASSPSFSGAVGATLSFSTTSAIEYTSYSLGDEFKVGMPAHNQGAFFVNVNGIGDIPMRMGGGLDDPEPFTFLSGRRYKLVVDTVGGDFVMRWLGEVVNAPNRPAGDSGYAIANTSFVTGAIATSETNSRAELAEIARYPNSVPAAIDDYTGSTDWVIPSGAVASIEARNGYMTHVLSQPPGAPTYASLRLPAAQIGQTRGVVSFSCVFEAEAATGTGGATRVLLMFFDGSSEISGSRQTRDFTASAAISPTRVSFADVTLPAGCDSIRIVPDAQPGSGATGPRKAWVRDILLAEGSSATYRRRSEAASEAGSEASLLSYSVLPDLPAGAPSGGFTCTGLDRITTGTYAGCWLIISDGRTVEGDASPFAPRAVIVSPDFQRALTYFDLSDPTLDGAQGGVWDPTDGSIWVCRPGIKRIENYSVDGTEVVANRIDLNDAGWTGAWTGCNGLAYDPVRDMFYVSSASSATVYRIAKSLTIDATLTLGTSSPDQLTYLDGILYVSVGSNGADGAVHTLDVASGDAGIRWSNLTRAQAIEGIYIDSIAARLYAVNDGGFHTAADPALNIALTYQIG